MSRTPLELATRARVDVAALEQALGRHATPRAREICARLWTSIEAMARAIEEAAPREAAPREAAPPTAQETLAMLRGLGPRPATAPAPMKRPTGGRPNPVALHAEPDRRWTNSRHWKRARKEAAEPGA